MAVLVLLEAVAIAILGLLVVGLLRSHAEILAALHRLGEGRGTGRPGTGSGTALPDPRAREPGRGQEAAWGPALDVAGVDPDGEPVAVGVAGAGHDSLLVFLSSGCTTCAGLWAALADPASLALLAGGVRPVVVTRSPDEESRAGVAALAPASVPVVMSSAAWDDYGVPGSPFFIHVDGPAGRVAGQGVAGRWDQVVALLGQAAANRRLELSPTPGGRSDAARGDAARGDAARGDAARGDTAREARADQELRAAGIGPGHPSLYRTDLAPVPGPDRPVEVPAQPGAGPGRPGAS